MAERSLNAVMHLLLLCLLQICLVTEPFVDGRVCLISDEIPILSIEAVALHSRSLRDLRQDLEVCSCSVSHVERTLLSVDLICSAD